MAQFQNSNLPERSVPWGREIEAAIEAANGDTEGLYTALGVAQAGLESQAAQLKQLTDYIRILCQNMGNTFPPTYVAPIAPVPDPTDPTSPGTPEQQYFTTDIIAQWSATWYQGFKRTSNTEGYDDKRSLYQRGTGYTFSMFGFGAGSAAGKNIQSASLYLSNISTYYGGPFTAILGTHGSAGEPSARPAGGRQNGWDVGWTAGEGKWVSIDPTLLPGISNGSIQGFTLGDLGRDNNNFARFNGVGRAGTPVLRLTYAV